MIKEQEQQQVLQNKLLEKVKAETVVVEKAQPVVDPEIQRQLIEKTKQIYMQMPRDKESVLSASIDFPQLVERNLIEKVVRKWVAAKIKQLLGVEEQAMINLVCVHLRTM